MAAVADRRKARRRVIAAWCFAAVFAASLLAGAVVLGDATTLAVAFALALGILLAADRAMRRPGGVPILVYHSVSPDGGWLPWVDNISVRPETFRRHMEVLRSAGRRVVSTRDLVRARADADRLDSRSVVLHFDDGYLDNHVAAVPILREFGYPATIFVSSDFIEAGDAVRPSLGASGEVRWQGYMTRAELREIDADPLFEIACHGRDHGRIPVSGRVVGRLDSRNWRFHAPLLWALTPGSKARWYEAAEPHPMRLGDPVLQGDSSLCGRWWRSESQESDADRDARVEADLNCARLALERVLGRGVDMLCWPFDRVTPAALDAARRAGFAIVTGGRGENRPDEDPGVLSRIHIHDRGFGRGGLGLEALVFRAKVGLASGNAYWFFLVALASLARRLRYRQPGVHS